MPDFVYRASNLFFDLGVTWFRLGSADNSCMRRVSGGLLKTWQTSNADKSGKIIPFEKIAPAVKVPAINLGVLAHAA